MSAIHESLFRRLAKDTRVTVPTMVLAGFVAGCATPVATGGDGEQVARVELKHPDLEESKRLIAINCGPNGRGHWNYASTKSGSEITSEPRYKIECDQPPQQEETKVTTTTEEAAQPLPVVPAGKVVEQPKRQTRSALVVEPSGASPASTVALPEVSQTPVKSRIFSGRRTAAPVYATEIPAAQEGEAGLMPVRRVTVTEKTIKDRDVQRSFEVKGQNIDGWPVFPIMTGIIAKDAAGAALAPEAAQTKNVLTGGNTRGGDQSVRGGDQSLRGGDQSFDARFDGRQSFDGKQIFNGKQDFDFDQTQIFGRKKKGNW